jgi:hypothetical protein
MNRIFILKTFAFLTIVILSSSFIDLNIKNDGNINSFGTMAVDTSDLVRLVKVDSFRLQIIPPSSGVQFYKDKIMFLSTSKNEVKMSATQISFGAVEAYYASVEDSVTGTHTLFSPLTSFSYPCDGITFSDDYNTIYYSKLQIKDKKEKIFKARITSDANGKTSLISDASPLDFCADKFNYSHPALSSDGETMIFASDAEGSIGGMDLYITRRSDDKWSAPENMGKLFNTTGNEFYPFLDSGNNLYYSSDGLPGHGGYDIFTCKFNGTNWNKPVNMSEPINSSVDDIAFTVNKINGKTAFFTRRQSPKSEMMQLFRVSLKEENEKNKILTIAYIFNGEAIAKANLTASAKTAETKPAETIPAGVKKDTVKTVAKETAKPKPQKEIAKKENFKPADSTAVKKRTEDKKNVPVNKSETTAPKVIKTEPAVSKPAPVEQKEAVIYKVQLLPDAQQRKAGEMVINSTTYKISEYIYLGSKRYTIGEYSSLSAATALQRICRQSGYPQSFVVAFKNNARSLDSNLFK